MFFSPHLHLVLFVFFLGILALIPAGKMDDDLRRSGDGSCQTRTASVVGWAALGNP